MSTINYQQPFEEDTHFQDYLKSKEEALKQKRKAARPQSAHMWALVFVLMLSLVGLGITALLQYKNNQELLAKYDSSSVAGVSETQEVQNIITAEGFSIVLQEATPKDYIIDRNAKTSQYVIGMPSVTTSLLASLNKDSKTIKSGIEVEVMENDNKLTKEQFTDEVVKKLGANYSKVNGDIAIAKDIKLTNIRNNTTTTDGTEYYTAVTAGNYYVIKVYNQTSPYPEFISYTRFTDKLLNNMYLN